MSVHISALRHLSGLSFTDAAYCQARSRLPRAVLEGLQRAVIGRLRTVAAGDPSTLWHGHRVYLLDGSSFSMPDTKALQKHFGQPGGQAAGCGFPVAHLLLLCDAVHGYILHTEALPLRTHDMAHAAACHKALRPGDVLVGVRAFATYAHLALCSQRGIYGLFRAHQQQIISFRPHRRHRTALTPKEDRKGLPTSRWLKRLGKHDQLVAYVKPKEKPVWLTVQEYEQLPASLVVREVRYRVREPGRRTRVITLVTTLLDPRRYRPAP